MSKLSAFFGFQKSSRQRANRSAPRGLFQQLEDRLSLTSWSSPPVSMPVSYTCNSFPLSYGSGGVAVSVGNYSLSAGGLSRQVASLPVSFNTSVELGCSVAKSPSCSYGLSVNVCAQPPQARPPAPSWSIPTWAFGSIGTGAMGIGAAAALVW